MNHDQPKQETKSTESCHCPARPYYSLGSLASGSRHEETVERRWESEHGHHSYAKARDELASALRYAEQTVGDGAAVLDMVHDVFGLERTK